MSKTIINLKDGLVEKVRKMTAFRTKVEIVNYALERLVEQKEIESILKHKGRISWKGDLDKMRKDR
jgi:Arc/MetJ family transcription regulator